MRTSVIPQTVPGPWNVTNGVIGAGDPGSTGGASSSSCMPITLFVKNVTVLTAGVPVDIATITVPAGITRFICILPASLSVIAETAAGTLAGAAFVAFTAPGGSGLQMTLGASGPASAGLKTSGAQNNINNLFATATIYIRQTLNSANAGTCSFYITIFPLP